MLFKKLHRFVALKSWFTRKYGNFKILDHEPQEMLSLTTWFLWRFWILMYLESKYINQSKFKTMILEDFWLLNSDFQG